MAFHWLTIVCWILAVFFLLVCILTVAIDDEDAACVSVILAAVLFGVGLVASGHANDQNRGLSSRNRKTFEARGYKVLHTYGHTVCVAVGVYKLCLQERKDATGKKQLVMPLAKGGVVVVGASNGESGFFDAISHAPNP